MEFPGTELRKNSRISLDKPNHTLISAYWSTIMKKMTKSEDDLTSFFREVGDIKRIDSSDKVYHGKSNENKLAQELRRKAISADIKRKQNYLTLEDIDPVHPDDPIWFKLDGVQDMVFKNLRLGKYSIDSTLNIQHLRLEAAHKEVFDYIMACHQKGLRSILIRHGKSINKKPFSGFMKSYTNVWLQQIPEIIAFHSSQIQHGGTGSTYVLLKKNKEQKAANRELHQKI